MENNVLSGSSYNKRSLRKCYDGRNVLDASFVCCLSVVLQTVFKSTNIEKTVCNIMLMSSIKAGLTWLQPYAIGIDMILHTVIKY